MENTPINFTDKADGTPGEKKTFDAVVAACDVPGIQKLLPEPFRKIKEVRGRAFLHRIGWPSRGGERERKKKDDDWDRPIGRSTTDRFLIPTQPSPPHPFPLVPQQQFDNIYKLEAVPVATVQLRFNGWVTELQVSPPARSHTHTLSALTGFREEW